ncbi:MAG: glycine--tRNA ligase subunit beta [Legionella sp.]|nr:glycine--tRNA ligase subunit beta [Legionella sp.]
MASDFIFELGCEELPSASVWSLANGFSNNLLAALDKAQLRYGEVKRFATPRRIAIIIYNLQALQSTQSNTRRGPPVAAAYTSEGLPTKALLGFAQSCDVDLSKLSRITTDKGEWITYDTQISGVQTKALLPGLVSKALNNLSLAKPMRWGDGHEEFARPVHWAVMLYNDEIIEHDFYGIRSSNQSRGHRFHAPQNLTILKASDYESQLENGFVIADFDRRRQMIKHQIQQLAESKGAVAVMPPELLDEVTSIVEWPQSLLVGFEDHFLKVPAEALIASMQAHQKCFALRDKSGNLLPFFITTSNISSGNPEQVVRGNEKVMRARLSDAAFFFKQDKTQKLSDYLASTKQVVFQNKLGSLYDKSSRILGLISYLCPIFNLPIEQAQRAASLSKCDLMTGMVGEFPELQGLMGYYYALHDEENPLVAQALNEQYMPRFAADDLPQTPLGIALSLADRLDTLVGIFAIGKKPSGIKDPFKLRRHALAVVRLLIVRPANIKLSEMIDEACRQYGDIIKDKSLLLELKSFILERLQSHYQSQGLSSDLIQAVRARQDECLYDLNNRLIALKSFMTLPEASALAAVCKRVNNLISQVDMDTLPSNIDERLFEEEAEKELFHQMNVLFDSTKELYASANYNILLHELANLKQPLDVFFEKVMILVENQALRNNRVAIMLKLQSLLQGVADISLLQTL